MRYLVILKMYWSGVIQFFDAGSGEIYSKV